MEPLSPFFLGAKPSMEDDRFAQSVILVIEHNDEGSYGVVVNCPLPLSLETIASDATLSYERNPEERAWYGGPMDPIRGTVLTRGGLPTAEDTVLDLYHYLSPRKDLLKTLLQDPKARFKLFLGYAGWGPNQLMDEIEEGTWHVRPFNGEWLLNIRPELLWEQALRESVL